MSEKIVVVKTGIANIGSVLAGIKRAGYNASVVSTPEELVGATHVIVPGVGHFSQAVQQLRAHNLNGPISVCKFWPWAVRKATSLKLDWA